MSNVGLKPHIEKPYVNTLKSEQDRPWKGELMPFNSTHAELILQLAQSDPEKYLKNLSGDNPLLTTDPKIVSTLLKVSEMKMVKCHL